MQSSTYRWVIVGIGGLMGCVAIGAMFSLAVFLGPISTATGWSRATISTAMTLDFLVMGLAGFGWGMASDRFDAYIRKEIETNAALVKAAGIQVN